MRARRRCCRPRRSSISARSSSRPSGGWWRPTPFRSSTSNVLEAQYKAAEAALATAEAERDRGVITAPWDGVITEVSEVGTSAFAFAGKEIAQIVGLDPMLAVVEVSERKVANVKVGDMAEVKLVSGQSREGRIRYVSKSAVPATRTYRVEVELPNADGAIPDGITAEVTIPLAPMPATRVPRSALVVSSAGDIGVRTVDAESQGRIHSARPLSRTISAPCGSPACRMARASSSKARISFARAIWSSRSPRPSRPRSADGNWGRSHVEIHRLRDQPRPADDRHSAVPAGAGFVAYVTIPKEAEPDVRIPIVYVQLTQRGISPEDSERLLLRPVETQLKSVSNVKEMRSTAYEGGGSVLLEFEAGFDSKSALADVRAKVDQAKRDLPKDADEPSVQEVNLSLYPVLVVALSGQVPERTMLQIARAAKNSVEQVPGVLSAELRGSRDEAVEIIVDPTLLKAYNLPLDQLIIGFNASNSLIAAGALEGSTGRFAVKVPSLIERPQDVLKIPMAASNGAAVTVGDVVQIRPTFKDATSVTRVNGMPAMTIEVSKRTGANLIETVDGVKKVIETLRADMAGGRPGDLHPGQVEGHPPDAVRSAELGHHRRAAGRGHHPVRAGIPCFAVHRHRDPGVVPRGRARPAACRADGQHRRAVLADPRRRHAGRRRHHRLGVRRAAHGGGHAAEGGLCARGQADVRSGDRRDRDAGGGVLAAAVLAGRGRRVHEISADHADRDAVGIACGGAVLHADAWRVARQSLGQAA